METKAGSDNLEIRTRVKWLMILRAAVITVLLGSLAALQLFQQREPVPAIYLIIIVTYLLTIAYSILFYRVKDLAAFAYAQILGDVFIETGVVFATGGVESAFSFTYIFSAIAAGMILYKRGSFVVASLAGISYAALAELQYYGLVLSSPVRGYTESEVFYNIFLNFVAFYTVAFLASSLSERLRATKYALDEKSTDLRELQALNESIVRSMADGMVTVGLDGRVTAFNKAAEDITGIPAAEARGMPFAEIFNWLGIETFFVDMEAAGRLPYRSELVYARGDKELILGMTLSPLRNELGGITGLLFLPAPISVAHGTLAQTFFCIVVAIALFTSPGWQTPVAAREEHGAPSLRTLAVVTTAAVYVQLILGATMRHLEAGLAIPDYPLAFGRLVPPFDAPGVGIHFAHRIGSLVVALCTGYTVTRVLARHRAEPALVAPAVLLAALVVTQFVLGASTVWSGKAVVPTTLHVLNGALVLITSLVLALRSFKYVVPEHRSLAYRPLPTERVAT